MSVICEQGEQAGAAGQRLAQQCLLSHRSHRPHLSISAVVQRIRPDNADGFEDEPDEDAEEDKGK